MQGTETGGPKRGPGDFVAKMKETPEGKKKRNRSFDNFDLHELKHMKAFHSLNFRNKFLNH